MNELKILPFIYGLAALLRQWLILSDYQKLIAERSEVSTALNSWKVVTEGLYLKKLGIDPYTGDQFHETPIHLYVYKLLIDTFGDNLIALFIIIDIATAHLLYLVAKNYMYQIYTTQQQKMDEYSKDASKIMMHGKDFLMAPIYVIFTYLYNPFIILNCVGYSTSVFNNFFMALFLYGLLNNCLIVTCICLMLCITKSLYPVVLLSPLFLHFLGKEKSFRKASLVVISVLALTIYFMYVCYNLEGNFMFMKNVYGFILNVPDLRPNIGLYWYFFIDMFDHFRNLFMCSFQINAFLLYLIPLSISFRHDPFLLAFILLYLTTIFKSYPTIGDVGFVFALLPCWSHLQNYMHQGFVIGVALIMTIVLTPIFWHLWIYTRSANANFYFGVTLAFATIQIMLLSNILFAYFKREFVLKFGKYRKIYGDDVMLVIEK